MNPNQLSKSPAKKKEIKSSRNFGRASHRGVFQQLLKEVKRRKRQYVCK